MKPKHIKDVAEITVKRSDGENQRWRRCSAIVGDAGVTVIERDEAQHILFAGGIDRVDVLTSNGNRYKHEYNG